MVKPPRVALPTACDLSLVPLLAALRETLLLEVEFCPIGRATLELELLEVVEELLETLPELLWEVPVELL